MEKISRILPPSARTKSYDVARAQPVRPGAPTIGRPEMMSTAIEDRMTISDQLVSPILNGDTMPSTSTVKETYKPLNTIKSQMVKEMTDKFFTNQNPKEVARDSSLAQSEELASKAQSTTGSSVKPDSSSEFNL